MVNERPTDGSGRHRQPTLVLFCGPPGSGKTTLAKALETQGRGVRICTDDWQESLGIDHNDDDFHNRLQTRLYRHALDLLDAGHDVILEDGLWLRRERDEKLADARRHGARTELHVFDLTVDQLWDRVERRNSQSPPGAVHIARDELERICALFERPDATELAMFGSHEIHRADSNSVAPEGGLESIDRLDGAEDQPRRLTR